MKIELPTEGFYLQDSRSFTGNEMIWWKKNCEGYTTDLREAHVFSKQEFAKGASRRTDVFWPVAYINSICRPSVDMQKARKSERPRQ